MKKIVGFFMILIGISLILGVFGQSIFTRTAANDRVDLSISDFQSIKIKTTAIDWEVRTSTSDQLTVELINPKKNQHLEVNEGRNQLEVVTKEKGGFNFFNFSGGETKLMVYVPEKVKASLDFITVSGDIYMADYLTSDSLYVKTVSGDIDVTQTIEATDVKVETVSGDVELAYVESEQLEFKTTSGDVELDQVAGEIIGKTVSGDVSLSFSAENKAMDIRTTSGDVGLIVSNPNMDFQLQTTSGTLEVHHEMRQESSTRRELSGMIGNGDYSVQIATTSGDIKIH
ncbi:hypothetical protein AJ85_07265 [Alkalihalobacillus alcalophilus ATCC 27647 = CGMCC 1.3604]|uniref:DUF4097 domain-containing protein n=1 Tax=Alkalihalobacillus alcalophilus ATCC 27647 = CGMCC 1.3604 TaxID=1218173 RepID=A0A4S4JXQ1_ALKAL|nr:DUF4097 family beta strand repeat-containing protein [Alkalihalobacillus alcalophilus]MED1561038.1 DUF4097 family beta strand repeat-containing protein [Alkalihalobacillus alcalophilus]THG88339.1 hypothetical protein AJ85_07265 [Alkalihalobacillus alcalophilus ATCC 27647 = CGMCC 1.3604]